MKIKDAGIRRELNKALEGDNKINAQEMTKILSTAGDGQSLEGLNNNRRASSIEARDLFVAGAEESGSLNLEGIRGGLSKAEKKDLDNIAHNADMTSSAKMLLSDFLTGRASSTSTIEQPVETNTAGPVSHAKPVDFKGETTIAGKWRMNPEALQNKYHGVSPENFLATTVKVPILDESGNPTGVKEITRRDNQYFLDDNKEKVGYRLVPVSDQPMVVNGQQVSGSHNLDKLLKDNDADYAFLMYTHPELHEGDIQKLATQTVKPENGITHLAGYVGDGETVNSPRDYHSHKFQVRGYPATVVTINNGEEYLGKSMATAAKILNPTVKFPGDYKNDKLMAFNLKNTFKFYKATLEGDTSITDNPDWNQYCAEHQLMLSSVGLNLPQNLKGYQEVYGDEDGAKLWEIAKSKGVEEAPADFEPHYKKLGMKPPRGNFDGPFQESGKAMAWVPETTADIVQDFVSTYAPFKEVGGRMAAGVIGGFKDTVLDRMGISEEKFDEMAKPIQGLLLQADAKVAGGMSVDDADAWLQTEMKPLLDIARGVQVSDDSHTQRYSAPADLMRHVNGSRGLGNGLTYKVLGTIVDSSEVLPAE